MVHDTLLILVRHADADAAGRLCGRYDVPLSGAGQRNLLALRSHCSGSVSPDALYTSPLRRARETATVLEQTWRMRAAIAKGLSEINCGHLEGMSYTELERMYPELWARNMDQKDDDFVWPGGESYREFRERVHMSLAEIAARHAGGRVVIITHAGVVNQVIGARNTRPPAEWEHCRPAPVAATKFRWRNALPDQLLYFNKLDWCEEFRPRGE